MNRIGKCCQCLTLRSVTSLLQLLIVIIVLGLCSIILTVNRIIMDSLISEISDALLLKQNFQQYEIQTELFKHQANWPLIKGFKILQDFSYIHDILLPTLDIQGYTPPLICPPYHGEQHFNNNNTLLLLPEFCIVYENPERAKDQNHFYLYLNFLNSLLVPLSLNVEEVYFTNTDHDYLFSSCPPLFDFPDYDPQLRPWFINHMIQAANSTSDNSAYVSDLYQSYGSNQYSFTLTQSLHSLNQSILAVLGYDLSFNGYSSLLQQKQFVYFIVNTFGQIINTNQEYELNIDLIEQQVQIFQQNITGFDENDWNQIKNSIISSKFVNSCSFQINHLCRYNEKYHQDIILHLLNLHSDFYLIIFQNITIQQENIARGQKNKLEIVSAFSRILMYQVGISIILLFFTWTGMYLFFRPITKMRQILNMQIRYRFASPGWEKNCHRACDDKKNSFFNQAFAILKTKITDIKNKKCMNCHLIENFKYPRKQLSIEFFSIKESIKTVRVILNYYQLQDPKPSEVENFNFCNPSIIIESCRNQQQTTNQQRYFQHMNSNPQIMSETDENVKFICNSDTFRFL